MPSDHLKPYALDCGIAPEREPERFREFVQACEGHWLSSTYVAEQFVRVLRQDKDKKDSEFLFREKKG